MADDYSNHLDTLPGKKKTHLVNVSSRQIYTRTQQSDSRSSILVLDFDVIGTWEAAVFEVRGCDVNSVEVGRLLLPDGDAELAPHLVSISAAGECGATKATARNLSANKTCCTLPAEVPDVVTSELQLMKV